MTGPGDAGTSPTLETLSTKLDAGIKALSEQSQQLRTLVETLNGQVNEIVNSRSGDTDGDRSRKAGRGRCGLTPDSAKDAATQMVARWGLDGEWVGEVCMGVLRPWKKAAIFCNEEYGANIEGEEPYLACLLAVTANNARRGFPQGVQDEASVATMKPIRGYFKRLAGLLIFAAQVRGTCAAKSADDLFNPGAGRTHQACTAVQTGDDASTDDPWPMGPDFKKMIRGSSPCRDYVTNRRKACDGVIEAFLFQLWGDAPPLDRMMQVTWKTVKPPQADAVDIILLVDIWREIGTQMERHRSNNVTPGGRARGATLFNQRAKQFLAEIKGIVDETLKVGSGEQASGPASKKRGNPSQQLHKSLGAIVRAVRTNERTVLDSRRKVVRRMFMAKIGFALFLHARESVVHRKRTQAAGVSVTESTVSADGAPQPENYAGHIRLTPLDEAGYKSLVGTDALQKVPESSDVATLMPACLASWDSPPTTPKKPPEVFMPPFTTAEVPSEKKLQNTKKFQRLIHGFPELTVHVKHRVWDKDGAVAGGSDLTDMDQSVEDGSADGAAEFTYRQLQVSLHDVAAQTLVEFGRVADKDVLFASRKDSFRAIHFLAVTLRGVVEESVMRSDGTSAVDMPPYIKNVIGSIRVFDEPMSVGLLQTKKGAQDVYMETAASDWVGMVREMGEFLHTTNLDECRKNFEVAAEDLEACVGVDVGRAEYGRAGSDGSLPGRKDASDNEDDYGGGADEFSFNFASEGEEDVS